MQEMITIPKVQMLALKDRLNTTEHEMLELKRQDQSLRN